VNSGQAGQVGPVTGEYWLPSPWPEACRVRTAVPLSADMVAALFFAGRHYTAEDVASEVETVGVIVDGQEELLEDFISLVTTFAGRLDGMRSASARQRLPAESGQCPPGGVR
jgi:hypothetical protein